MQLQQALEAVVAVDDAAVEVVQVRGGEATAIQGHQGAQIGRQHGDGGQHQPLGFVAALAHGLDDLEALADLLDLGFAGGLDQALDLLLPGVDLAAQSHGQVVQGLDVDAVAGPAGLVVRHAGRIEVGQQFEDRLAAHLQLEEVRRRRGVHRQLAEHVQHVLVLFGGQDATGQDRTHLGQPLGADGLVHALDDEAVLDVVIVLFVDQRAAGDVAGVTLDDLGDVAALFEQLEVAEQVALALTRHVEGVDAGLAALHLQLQGAEGDVLGAVQHVLQILQGHVEQVTDT